VEVYCGWSVVRQTLVAVFLNCLFQESLFIFCVAKGGEASKDQQEEVEVSERQSHGTEEQHGKQTTSSI
jgi:hypothetical protein